MRLLKVLRFSGGGGIAHCENALSGRGCLLLEKQPLSKNYVKKRGIDASTIISNSKSRALANESRY